MGRQYDPQCPTRRQDRLGKGSRGHGNPRNLAVPTGRQCSGLVVNTISLCLILAGQSEEIFDFPQVIEKTKNQAMRAQMLAFNVEKKLGLKGENTSNAAVPWNQNKDFD